MEEFVREETDAPLASVPAAAVAVTLQAVIDQGDFEQRYPDEKTLRDGRPYPTLLHDVAVGRAAAELTRRGGNRAGGRLYCDRTTIACYVDRNPHGARGSGKVSVLGPLV